MDAREIGQWCLDNKRMISKIIMKYDRYPDNYQDNFNYLSYMLMTKGIKFEENRGIKFSTYAFPILNRGMIEYLAWKTSKLSYPHYVLTTNKMKETRMNLEKKSKSFGVIPDFVEAKAGAKDLSFIDEDIDSEIFRRKVNKIVNEYTTPTQRNLFKYRYNDDLTIKHGFQECADMFGFSVARAKQLENKVIGKIRKYLYLENPSEDKRVSEANKIGRIKNIEEQKRNSIW